MNIRVGDYLKLSVEELKDNIVKLEKVERKSWKDEALLTTITDEFSEEEYIYVKVLEIEEASEQILIKTTKIRSKTYYIVLNLSEKYNILPRVKDKVKVDIGEKEYIMEVKAVREDCVLERISIAAEFSKRNKMGHDCDGYCEDGKGYWLLDYEIKEIIRKEEDEGTKIKELTSEVKKLTTEIKKKDKIQDLLTGAIIDKAKDIAIDDLKEHLKEKIDEYIEKEYGALPKKVIVETKTERKEMQGIFHKEFENICKIVAKNIPLMLVGSAGAGKNYTLEQVAEALDLKFYFSNAVNQEYKLTGFIDANGVYHETEFYKAFTKGGMFFLDEIDASCAECLVILNSAIANGYFDFPNGRAKAHKDFRVVCAGNTYGTGADMVYVGRNVLDGATLDRFVVLQFDYDEEVEKQLAYDNELYLFIKDLRKAINDSGLRYIVSMRAIINSSKLMELGVPKIDILKTSIIKNMQIDDINNIVGKLKNGVYDEWKNGLRSLSDVEN